MIGCVLGRKEIIHPPGSLAWHAHAWVVDAVHVPTFKEGFCLVVFLTLHVQAWVDDIACMPEMNEVYDAWVSKTMPPPRACVQSKLIPGCKVEFRCTAAQIDYHKNQQ